MPLIRITITQQRCAHENLRVQQYREAQIIGKLKDNSPSGNH